MKDNIARRSFLKAALLAGGGLMLRFNWPTAVAATTTLEDLAVELNSYIKISPAGGVTLYNPNPEFGQNVKTSLPMILAEELDVAWEDVEVVQADFYPERYERQFTGGSNSIRVSWEPLRKAGATARYMLMTAAAGMLQVPISEISTADGVLHHHKSGRKIAYGEAATQAAAVPVPESVTLKDPKDFKIIGTSKGNVEIDRILTGKPLFTSDYKVDGMLIAMIIHPPAFGLEYKSHDERTIKDMPGIRQVFVIETLPADIEQNAFDVTSFAKMVVLIGDSTWQVMQAKKKLHVEWQEASDGYFNVGAFGGNARKVKRPAGLESTSWHLEQMAKSATSPAEVRRRDGDPEAAFSSAAKIIERTYTAPYLVHNTMEPVCCFANVTADAADIYGPIQAPEFIVNTIATRIGMPKEKVKIRLARMGGGFGLRAYGHHLVEAAVISQHVKSPIRLVYTREDEATYGIYRPTYSATYRAALDEKNQLIGLHIKAGGIPESPLHENRFPAGAVDHYLAESWAIESNITIGAFRAPRSNFIASAEQSFLDELAFEMNQDPIAFRLSLLERARTRPVGDRNEYDAERYIEVLKLVRDKSNWGQPVPEGMGRGVAAYFCHNTYAATVVDMQIQQGEPRVLKVVAAADCGIVINKDASINMAEGAIIDGVNNALFGEQRFENGQPLKSNFSSYRMIRINEVPKEIEVHFVDNGKNPTGMGEPLFPPMFGAIANGLYGAAGKRFYVQPFVNGCSDDATR